MPSSPMTKATVASTALAGVSNLIAQILKAHQDSQPFSFDMAMFLRFVTVALLTAPPNYIWQQFLERTFPAYEIDRPTTTTTTSDDDPRDLEKQQQQHIPMTETAVGGGGGGGGPPRRLNMRNTFSKWFIDCMTLGAIFNTLAFFVLMGLLKGQPVGVIARNIYTKSVPLIVAGYKIWPFASIVSFSCVPVERRIVFLNFIGLLWGVYMSLVAERV